MSQPGDERISFDKPAGPPPSATSGYPSGYPAADSAPGYGASGYGAPGYGAPSYGAYPAPGYGFPPAGGPPPFPKPSTNIGWAIGAVFLFWPLCIPAFINATKVDSAYYAGDYFGAKRASDDAKKYGLIGVIVGASLIVLYFVFIFVVFGIVLTAASHVQPSPVYPS